VDETTFDGLSRCFATRDTRRRGLRLLAGAILGGGLLGLPTVEMASAACSRLNQRCGKGKKCCAGTVCRSGKCRCKSGLLACSGRCVDTRTDPANCGGCGKPCTPGQACAGGVCTGCPDGQKACDGRCIPRNTCCRDADCTEGKRCQPNGTCACAGNLVPCNGACRECCSELQCPAGQFCRRDFTCGCEAPSGPRVAQTRATPVVGREFQEWAARLAPPDDGGARPRREAGRDEHTRRRSGADRKER
jgi:hypothetical protein